MRFVADEKTLPRLHLAGTLGIVLLLTLVLAGLFAWHGYHARREALGKVEQAAVAQIRARLSGEMDRALGAIEFTRARTEQTLRRSLVNQVDAAHGVAEAIHASESRRRGPAEVKRLIVEALRSARFFDGRGYHFINDMQGRIVLLPINTEREGQPNLDNQDDRGQPVMGALIEAGRRPRGEGFARYRWYPPGSDRMEDKLSYVRHFAPYDWLIGTGDYLFEWEDYQRREALDRVRQTSFGRTGYIAVVSLDGFNLMMPGAPGSEGRKVSELPAPQAAVIQRTIELAREGGGFISYDWPDPASGEVSRKTALVKPYSPWGWVLVVTMFDDEIKAVVDRELRQQQLLDRDEALGLMLALLAVAALGVVASLAFSRWSGQLFRAYHLRQTEQQQALRESENRLNTILDGVEACIFIKDREFRYLYANRLACELLGHPLERIVGRVDAEIIDPAWAEKIAAADHRVIVQGERVAVEQSVTIAGRPRTLATVKLPLRDTQGRIYAMCGVSTDITERKRSEVELAAARDAAESANRAKADFLANVSHELRTPMNVILGMLHLVRQSPLSPQQQERLLQIDAASHQLLGVITDILDFSSLDDRRLELDPEPFALAELLDSIAERFAARAAVLGLDFTIEVAPDVPARLHGDPYRLGQALQHYADNALKFSEQGSVAVRVTVQRDEPQQCWLRFEVADTGIGFAPELLQRLFSGFVQADASSTRRRSGTGLGLVLVKRLAGLMDGEVGCDSRPGQGSTFWFTARLGRIESADAAERLPYRWQPDAASAAAEPQDPAPDERWRELKGRLIELLGNDDVDSLQLFEQNEAIARAALGAHHAELARAMRSYDFPTALAALQQA